MLRYLLVMLEINSDIIKSKSYEEIKESDKKISLNGEIYYNNLIY